MVSGVASFKKTIWKYYRENGRVLPWRIAGDKPANKNAGYKILVSEFMLQQTQVPRVLEKFKEFIKLFPTIEALANATQESVLKAWQGLGYNRRALFLKKTAEILYKDYRGNLPEDPAILEKLPGIGPYTTRAIATFCRNAPYAFIETNIRSVYLHHFFADKDGVSDVELLSLVEKTLDKTAPRQWYYALMDYGSFLKKTVGNANTKSKHYARQSAFHGSRRQARGIVLKYALERGKISATEAIRLLKDSPYEPSHILDDLVKEGFLKKQGRTYRPA